MILTFIQNLNKVGQAVLKKSKLFNENQNYSTLVNKGFCI